MKSNDSSNKKKGEIITFYSYKGGTGRSMALSNVACLLALRSGGNGILMIDWDLEAPGLHRFFFQHRSVQAFSHSHEVDQMPGLIDLFIKLNLLTGESGSIGDENIANSTLDKINLDDFVIPTQVPHLSMIKAGRFDETYYNKVGTFDWVRLFTRTPSLIRLFAERLEDRYRYILIDSRTGYSDISGICTMLLPQVLVFVFAPNHQSYTGIQKMVRDATKYRKESNDLRPLLVYPLPSRIEFARDDLRKYWRYGNSELNIPGYQPMFERLFEEVYGLGECNLDNYFNEVQIQQSINYAYGEEIAVLQEKIKDVFSLSRSYEIFSNLLSNSIFPWEKKGR